MEFTPCFACAACSCAVSADAASADTALGVISFTSSGTASGSCYLGVSGGIAALSPLLTAQLIAADPALRDGTTNVAAHTRLLPAGTALRAVISASSEVRDCSLNRSDGARELQAILLVCPDGSVHVRLPEASRQLEALGMTLPSPTAEAIDQLISSFHVCVPNEPGLAVLDAAFMDSASSLVLAVAGEMGRVRVFALPLSLALVSMRLELVLGERRTIVESGGRLTLTGEASATPSILYTWPSTPGLLIATQEGLHVWDPTSGPLGGGGDAPYALIPWSSLLPSSSPPAALSRLPTCILVTLQDGTAVSVAGGGTLPLPPPTFATLAGLASLLSSIAEDGGAYTLQQAARGRGVATVVTAAWAARGVSYGVMLLHDSATGYALAAHSLPSTLPESCSPSASPAAASLSLGGYALVSGGELPGTPPGSLLLARPGAPSRALALLHLRPLPSPAYAALLLAAGGRGCEGEVRASVARAMDAGQLGESGVLAWARGASALSPPALAALLRVGAGPVRDALKAVRAGWEGIVAALPALAATLDVPPSPPVSLVPAPYGPSTDLLAPSDDPLAFAILRLCRLLKVPRGEVEAAIGMRISVEGDGGERVLLAPEALFEENCATGGVDTSPAARPFPALWEDAAWTAKAGGGGKAEGGAVATPAPAPSPHPTAPAAPRPAPRETDLDAALERAMARATAGAVPAGEEDGAAPQDGPAFRAKTFYNSAAGVVPRRGGERERDRNPERDDWGALPSSGLGGAPDGREARSLLPSLLSFLRTRLEGHTLARALTAQGERRARGEGGEGEGAPARLASLRLLTTPSCHTAAVVPPPSDALESLAASLYLRTEALLRAKEGGPGGRRAAEATAALSLLTQCAGGEGGEGGQPPTVPALVAALLGAPVAGLEGAAPAPHSTPLLPVLLRYLAALDPTGAGVEALLEGLSVGGSEAHVRSLYATALDVLPQPPPPSRPPTGAVTKWSGEREVERLAGRAPPPAVEGGVRGGVRRGSIPSATPSVAEVAAGAAEEIGSAWAGRASMSSAGGRVGGGRERVRSSFGGASPGISAWGSKGVSSSEAEGAGPHFSPSRKGSGSGVGGRARAVSGVERPASPSPAQATHSRRPAAHFALPPSLRSRLVLTLGAGRPILALRLLAGADAWPLAYALLAAAEAEEGRAGGGAWGVGGPHAFARLCEAAGEGESGPASCVWLAPSAPPGLDGAVLAAIRLHGGGSSPASPPEGLPSWTSPASGLLPCGLLDWRHLLRFVPAILPEEEADTAGAPAASSAGSGARQLAWSTLLDAALRAGETAHVLLLWRRTPPGVTASGVCGLLGSALGAGGEAERVPVWCVLPALAFLTRQQSGRMGASH
jgi:hypothetical protein